MSRRRLAIVAAQRPLVTAAMQRSHVGISAGDMLQASRYRHPARGAANQNEHYLSRYQPSPAGKVNALSAAAVIEATT